MSRFDSEYHEVLLIWRTEWNRPTIDRALQGLNDTVLRSLRTCSIYSSGVQQLTMMHLGFDEDLSGFKKNYFAASQRRKGSKVLCKMELPTKWNKYLSTKDIMNHLHKLFETAHDLKIYGHPSAFTRYEEWKTINDLKTSSKKEAMKVKLDALDDSAKVKHK